MSLGRKLSIALSYVAVLTLGVAVGAVGAGQVSAATGAVSARSVGPDNYQVEIKTRSKQCFGSAGCILEISLILSVDRVIVGIPAELKVRVTGDESGPLVETISIDDDKEYDAPELVISTPSSSTKVRARVTKVKVL